MLLLYGLVLHLKKVKKVIEFYKSLTVVHWWGHSFAVTGRTLTIAFAFGALHSLHYSYSLQLHILVLLLLINTVF